METQQPATHAALSALVFDDGQLTWGDRKVSDLASLAGQTPFYAYDLNRMSDRVAALRDAMPPDLHVHYAMKANPMPEVVNHMAGIVDGLDVASIGELHVAVESGMSKQDISFAGPGKRDAELSAAISAGITINMESPTEMRRIARIGNDLGTRPVVAIRVNPAFELKTAGMKMGGRPSQFGMDAETVPAILAELETLDLEFRGFHVFSGSQNLRPDAIVEAMDKTAELAVQLAASTTLTTSLVNIGGGLGIPYFPNEQALELDAISAAAHRVVDRLRSSLGEVEVVTELGRFLVGEAGIYVVRVIDIKTSRGSRFAVCDGGLHHHLAASGNFGQVLRKNYPVVAVDASGELEEISVVGPLCTPLDLLGDRMVLSRVEVGDLIAILQSGAYGASASPAGFLSHPPCVEIVC